MRDVRLPEAVGQDAEAEVDAAAAEEQRADEEEAGREDADPRVSAVREVLVDRPCARVLPGVERDRVGDREHAERRRAARPASRSSRRRCRGARPRRGSSATENIGPIASACATACIVVRFFLPSVPRGGPLLRRPPGSSQSASRVVVRRRSDLRSPGAARYNVRTSNVNHSRPTPGRSAAGAHAARPLGRRARLRRDPLADRLRARSRPARASARATWPTASASPAARCARRCAGSPATGSSTSRSTAASSSRTPGSTTCASGSRPGSPSSPRSRGSPRSAAADADLELMRATIAAEASRAQLGRGARREPRVPLRRRGRDAEPRRSRGSSTALWIADVGRRLLAQRRRSGDVAGRRRRGAPRRSSRPSRRATPSEQHG